MLEIVVAYFFNMQFPPFFFVTSDNEGNIIPSKGRKDERLYPGTFEQFQDILSEKFYS